MVEKSDGMGLRIGLVRRRLARNTWMGPASARPTAPEVETAVPQEVSVQDVSAEETIRRLRQRLRVERCLFSAALAVVTGMWGYPAVFPSVWAVYVNGNPVVGLRSRDSAQAVLAHVRQQEPGAASAAPLSPEVRLGPARPSSVKVVDPGRAEQRLAGVLELSALRTLVCVNGKVVAALADQSQAEEALQRVKDSFARRLEKLDGEPEFKERVELRPGRAEEDLWADAETAAALLRGAEGPEDSAHVAAAGETAATIARQYGLTVDRLAELNPKLDLERLAPGQEVCVGTGSPPLVTVLTEGRTSGTEQIPYESVAVPTRRMLKGEWSLEQPGVPGRRRVLYHVRCENGKPVECRIIGRVLERRPQEKIERYGTRARSARD